jgi:hypothetical protein
MAAACGTRLRRADPRGPRPARQTRARPIRREGRTLLRPIRLNERSLDAADVVEGAELKGATPLMEFAGDGSTTFTY